MNLRYYKLAGLKNTKFEVRFHGFYFSKLSRRHEPTQKKNSRKFRRDHEDGCFRNRFNEKLSSLGSQFNKEFVSRKVDNAAVHKAFTFTDSEETTYTYTYYIGYNYYLCKRTKIMLKFSQSFLL